MNVVKMRDVLFHLRHNAVQKVILLKDLGLSIVNCMKA